MWNAWIYDVALEDLFSSYVGLHSQVMEVYDDVNALFGNKLLDILDSREPDQYNTINPGRSFKASVSNLKAFFHFFFLIVKYVIDISWKRLVSHKVGKFGNNV